MPPLRSRRSVLTLNAGPPPPGGHPECPSTSALRGGADMEQWQIEVTGAGRIWYLVDPANRILWIRLATTGHPAETD